MQPSDPLVIFRRTPVSIDRQDIEAFAQTLRLRLRADFTCLITSDSELQRLNAQFRGKDYPTDVLSFPGTNDLAVSYQRARAQAREFGHQPADEIKILMLHGVLHLLGMDHETDSGQMARRESLWRGKLGLPNSLIQRSAA